ncbi:MAG: alkaline phosphatase D family protein [Hyphomicrobiaceae bacterium]
MQGETRPRATPGRGAKSSGGAAALVLAVTLAAFGFALAQLPAPPDAKVAGSVAPATPWLVPQPAQSLDRIAFGSCLHQLWPQPILNAVVAARPQLFLMLGDNVYGDAKGASPEALAEAYRVQAAQPGLAALRAAVPVLATWDDHDYGKNDAGRELPWKARSRELFAEFWQLPPGTLPDGGVYRAVMLGPPGRRVQVILLDTRSFRSPLARRPAEEVAVGRLRGPYMPSTAADQDMLGTAQWAWLEAELRRPAELRLLVSSIQVLSDAHRFERWGNLPDERRRLDEVIARTGAKGLVILSGDRHLSAIYRKPGGKPYAYPEVTSSGLNRAAPATDPEEPVRVGDMYRKVSFGLIEIDWAARKLAATIRDENGRAVIGHEVALDELSP